MFNFINFLTLLSVFTLLVLMINNGVGNKKTKYFLALLIDNFLFILFFTIENQTYNIDAAIIFAKLTFIAVSLFPPLLILLIFQAVDQKQNKFINSRFSYILFLPSLFFIIMVLIKKYTLDIRPIENGYYIKIIIFSAYFLLYNFIYEIASIVLLIIAKIRNKANDLKKKELDFLIIGFSIPVVFMICKAILQWLGLKNNYPFEIWFSFFSSWFLYYGISRYGIIVGNIFNKKVFNLNSMLIIGVNLSGEVFEVNKSFLEFFGMERKEVYGKSVYGLHKRNNIYFNGFDKILRYINSFSKNEKIIKRKTNPVFEVEDINEKNVKYFEISVDPIFINNLLFGHIFILNDVTGRKTAENLLVRKQRLLEAIVKSIDELLSNSDLDSSIVKAFEHIGSEIKVDRVYIFENHADPLTGKVLTSRKFEWINSTTNAQISNPELVNIDFEVQLPEVFAELSNNRDFSGLVKDFPENLKQYFNKQNIVSVLLVPIFTEDKFWGYIGLDECQEETRIWASDEILIMKAAAKVIMDAITHMRMSETIRQLAYYDIITGLPNRALLYDRLKLSIEVSKRNKKLIAIALMDFDKFKEINDTYGHHVGDDFLKAFSDRISGIIRKSDTVSRFGGDEFIFILTNLSLKQDVVKIVDKILKYSQKPFVVQGHHLKIQGSIGIAVYPIDGTKVTDLIKNADIAMYNAKKLGGNGYQFYSDIFWT
ncbi:MAG: diguanylate cyclase [Actinomycetota bacterium]|nr:diguanylate cyclase [Actinomycetota bacterium]